MGVRERVYAGRAPAFGVWTGACRCCRPVVHPALGVDRAVQARFIARSPNLPGPAGPRGGISPRGLGNPHQYTLCFSFPALACTGRLWTDRRKFPVVLNLSPRVPEKTACKKYAPNKKLPHLSYFCVGCVWCHTKHAPC